MPNTSEPLIILMVDDDPDDYYLMNKALTETGIEGELLHLSDGVELMDYVSCREKYEGTKKQVSPALILLDLNMPRMDGMEALKKLKSMDHVKDIPVIIFTTSKENKYIEQCYRHGADEFIVKPSDFESLLNFAESIKNNWI